MPGFEWPSGGGARGAPVRLVLRGAPLDLSRATRTPQKPGHRMELTDDTISKR
jgi:hypothetical protein